MKKARPCAADSPPRCRWWGSFAAVAVSTGALVAQSGMAPLTLRLSDDNGVTWVDLIEVGAGKFMHVRCQTQSASSGGWYGAIADAIVLDPAYFELPDALPMQYEEVVLGTVVGPYAPPELYGTAYWTITARAVDVSAFLALTLGGPDPEECVVGADPLYLPPSGQTSIEQLYGVMPNAEWHPYDSGAFNVDDVLQKAVWRRVASPEITDPDAFFNGDQWRTLLTTPMQLNITLIGMKGPDVTIGVPAGNLNPPGLVGYPGNPPKLTISALARVTFTGSSGELWFYPEWSAPVLPIHGVPAGGTVVLPVSGNRPDMQVSLHDINPGTSPRFDVTARWATFGKVALPIPEGTSPATYEVRYYRYRTLLPGGGFLDGPWTLIPGGHRPRVMVQ